MRMPFRVLMLTLVVQLSGCAWSETYAEAWDSCMRTLDANERHLVGVTGIVRLKGRDQAQICMDVSRAREQAAKRRLGPEVIPTDH